MTLEPTWLGWLERASDQARKLDPIAGVSWLEMRTYMVSTLLRDTDSVSMARSLEVRVPLLDTPLVEFVSALPDEARVQNGRPKALLRAALGDLLPAEILQQRKRTFYAAVGRLDALGIDKENWGRALLTTSRRRCNRICVLPGCRWYADNFKHAQTNLVPPVVAVRAERMVPEASELIPARSVTVR